MTSAVATSSSLAIRARRLSPAGLGRFLLRRIAIGLVLVVGITLVAFLLTHLVPGDPAAANLGQRAIADPAAVAAFNHKYGLDKPVPEQYVIYLGHLVRGDLGISEQSHRAVTTDLGAYVPATLELALFAIVLCVIFGVALGVLAAVRRGRLLDGLLRVVSLVGVSVPTFWLALLVFYLGFYRLGWFPSGGRLNPGVTAPGDITGLYTVDSVLEGRWSLFADAFDHLILPSFVLGVYTVGLILRFTRASVLEILGNDYVRTARAKGLKEWTVIRRHVMRPALVSIATVFGVAFGSLLSGTVLVESIFSWPGIGQYAYNSAVNLDLPAIMGVSMVVAVIYIVINLLVDIFYSVLDPRIELLLTTIDALPLDPEPFGPEGSNDAIMELGRRDRSTVRPAWRNPLALVGGGIIVAWVVVAIIAPLIAPYPPNAQLGPTLAAPSSHYLFGTDEVGRDVLSRVIYGSRLSLPLAALLVVASMIIGALLGTVAGFFGGVVDAVIMRVADLVFAFPGIILALAVAAALGPELHNAVLAVIVVSWPSYARVARGLVLGARNADYIVAARLLGASGWRTMFVELRPNIAGPILVLASLDVGNAVLLLSGLSFLGLGAQPPVAEWGAMVASGAQNFSDWWLGLFPGLGILTVVMAFNFVGDALRDLLDPRTARLMGK